MAWMICRSRKLPSAVLSPSSKRKEAPFGAFLLLVSLPYRAPHDCACTSSQFQTEILRCGVAVLRAKEAHKDPCSDRRANGLGSRRCATGASSSHGADQRQVRASASTPGRGAEPWSAKCSGARYMLALPRDGRPAVPLSVITPYPELE
jgi:hypothetical protein